MSRVKGWKGVMRNCLGILEDSVLGWVKSRSESLTADIDLIGKSVQENLDTVEEMKKLTTVLDFWKDDPERCKQRLLVKEQCNFQVSEVQGMLAGKRIEEIVNGEVRSWANN